MHYPYDVKPGEIVILKTLKLPLSINDLLQVKGQIVSYADGSGAFLAGEVIAVVKNNQNNVERRIVFLHSPEVYGPENKEAA